MVIQQMFKYRIYPSSKQKVSIINNFKVCKSAYNNLLAISQDAYKFGKVSLTKFDYDSITKGYSSEVHSQVLQNVSDRVHKAFQNFFRRVKEHAKEKGFPRYKSRVMSITYPQSGFKFINNKHVQVSKIGNLPIILHRIPKGKIKTLTIKQNKAGQWFAVFSCELPDNSAIHPNPESKVGIDVGLENFATLSNGETIANPRFLVKAEHKLKRLQRQVSRKVKGSNNRRKARFELARQYLKVSNIRADWLHKLSRSLTLKYGIIAGENLNIKGMVQNHHLAKSISDASWGMFMDMLSYKAVASGGQFLENPKTRGSSQRCSGCGAIVDMPLSKRYFSCPNCSLSLHRDHNSAVNHIKDTAGLAGIHTPVDIEPLPSSDGKASSVVEAGTTCDSC
ncbi:transposase [Candidatus Woesearchaeota archaeon]|nr:transposase [Candidatus Woesearchaeota archaeon]